jgi:hypothetical protein
VSTCGVISPLKALNYLIHQLESDIVTIDYRVRGFTRDVNGMKHFIDHEINSIQNFMSEDMKSLYDMVDVNVYQENIFHTKMLLKEFDLKHYMFHTKPEELTAQERKEITEAYGKRCVRFTTVATFRPCDLQRSKDAPVCLPERIAHSSKFRGSRDVQRVVWSWNHSTSTLATSTPYRLATASSDSIIRLLLCSASWR